MIVAVLLVVAAYSLLVASIWALGKYSGALQCNGVDLFCIFLNCTVPAWLPVVAGEQI